MAEHFGLRKALAISGVTLLAGLALTYRRTLHASEEFDTRPSGHWPEPNLIALAKPEDGPVLVTEEYRIDLREGREFSGAMMELDLIRRRDGAIRWELFEDASDPWRYVECFVVESWAEHLRQHARTTMSDVPIKEGARAFHNDEGRPPKVTHWISARG